MAYLFSTMFLALVGYLVYFNVKLTDDVKRNPNNTKGDAQEAYVIRGTIYSSDGEVLAGTNVADDNTETRVYPWRNVFAHVVGYTVNGKSGLEAIYNNDLWLKELAEEQTKRLLEYYIKLRKQYKLSQSELERITGVSRISINRYENGKIMPSVQAVNQLLNNNLRWQKRESRGYQMF